ncbi:patatin-like protein 6 [Tanacetum coccineum]
MIRTTRKVCVLSIDGDGGMRGVLAGKALSYLEKVLKMKSGDPNARIADYIDVGAGTGVGGFFTGVLFGSGDRSLPLFEADDTWRFLVERGERMYCGGAGGGFWKRCFGGGSEKLMTKKFEDVMKEVFMVNGRSLSLKDTLKPVLIPCYDLSTSGSFVFSRAMHWKMSRLMEKTWLFCVDDGGCELSNPTAAAITHVLHNKQEFPFVRGVEDILVLSLGTGQVLEEKYDFDQVKKWKGKDWVKPMGRISGESSSDMVDHAVALAFGESCSSNYVRIQANCSNMGRYGANLDSDPSPSNVKALIGLADEMLRQKNVESVLFGGKRIGEKTNYEKLEWFAEELVLEHQRRSCRIAPTVAFKQATSKRH